MYALLPFIGGGSGGIWTILDRQWGETFPVGTLVINISGSFFIGLIFGLTEPDGRRLISPVLREFLIVCLCGGYTTFSSFSLETLKLLQDAQWFTSATNVLLSVVLCLVGIWLGHALAQYVNASKGH